MAMLRRLLRFILVTLLAACAGAPIAVSPFFLGIGTTPAFLPVVLLTVVLYFAALGIVGWPSLAALRLLGGYSRNTVVLTGSLMVAVCNVFVGGTFGSEAAIPIWLLAGLLSGGVAGFILWRLSPVSHYHREQLDTGNKHRFQAFFSYARADEKTASWLWQRLDSYRIPRDIPHSFPDQETPTRTLHPIFRDRVDLSAGGSVAARLDGALARSDSLIVLCTPHSAKSEWVDHEVKHFVKAGREHRILPVIADGEPNSGDAGTECFPPALRGRGLLAADLRHIKTGDGRVTGDGRRDGTLKLIAGLLGVEFDQLVRREHQRQQRRTTVLTSVVAVTASLALVALFLAYVALGAFTWSQGNMDAAIASEFEFLIDLHADGGAPAVADYLQFRRAAERDDGATSLCAALLDADGYTVAGTNVGLVRAMPERVGEPRRFTRESNRKNYETSPFNMRLDGLIQRVSADYVISVATCHYQPPMFYGVFRTFFAPEPAQPGSPPTQR